MAKRKKTNDLFIRFANLPLNSLEDYSHWLRTQKLSEVLFESSLISFSSDVDRAEILTDLKHFQTRIKVFLAGLIDQRSQLQDNRVLAERFWGRLAWMEDNKPYTLHQHRVHDQDRCRYFPKRERSIEYNPTMPWRHVYQSIEIFLEYMRPVTQHRQDERRRQLIFRVNICPRCKDFFWDSSKNITRKYCSDRCGNAERQRRYRQRICIQQSVIIKN